VDSKDFLLLAALHENARQSYQSLGKIVSLSAPAVHDRLKRLEKIGVLRGFWLTPDPAILGREDLLAFFQEEWDRAGMLKALSAPDVAWVA
jgi:Lrp/AsnC family leucine-responsive transcriptional regulator